MEEPAKRPFGQGQPDDGRPPRGQLRARIRDPELHADIRKADVVLGVHPATGEPVGLFYGIALIRRVVRRDSPEEGYVLRVPVDPDTDDVEVLCALVQFLRGAHCYGARRPVP